MIWPLTMKWELPLSNPESIIWLQEQVSCKKKTKPWKTQFLSKIDKFQTLTTDTRPPKQDKKNSKSKMTNSEQNLSRKTKRWMKCSQTRSKDLRYFFYNLRNRLHSPLKTWKTTMKVLWKWKPIDMPILRKSWDEDKSRLRTWWRLTRRWESKWRL